MVPAAVVSMGRNFGRWFAASNTALYPDIVAMLDSVSML